MKKKFEEEDVEEEELEEELLPEEEEEEENAESKYASGEKSWPVKTIVTITISGYITGIILILIWYTFHKEQSKHDLKLKWFFFTFFGLLCLILCYSRQVRCVASLCLPTLCTSQGRALVIAFAFFIAATGPIVNIITNVGILARSMSCGEIQLIEALDHVFDIIRQPMFAVKQALEIAMGELRKVMERVETVMIEIYNSVMYILQTFKDCSEWLKKIVSICNHEFGTPYRRCLRLAAQSLAKCKAKLGRFSELCKVTHVFRALCQMLEFVDYICDTKWDFNEDLIARIKQQLNLYLKEIQNIFEVSITFDQDYYFHTNASRNVSEIGMDIVQDINRSMRPFYLVFGWLDIVGTFFSFTVILKSIYFYLRYMHSLDYNNYFITMDFLEIDEQRRKRHMEVVLPLKRTERKKYIKLNSLRLKRSEMFLLVRTMMFTFITTIQLFCICFTDYGLFSFLALISYYGHKQAGLEAPPYIKIDVHGTGFLADVLRGITHAFEPLTYNYTIDVKECLPLPKKPLYSRYVQIFFLCLFAWLMLFFEPYGLRVRHVIMRWFYPNQSRRRAAHLYEKILLKRISFFKFARRKARALFMHQDPDDDYPCLLWLRAKFNHIWFVRLLLGKAQGTFCIICSKSLTETERILCDTEGCRAVYCKNCFNASNNICCLCKRPIDYGDFSDFSEVQDSSDDPDAVRSEDDDFCLNLRDTKKD